MHHHDENSVIRALADLHQLEEQRLAEKEAVAARERAEQAQARALQQAEQAHAERVAEAEARLRIEAKAQQQKANDRIAALQAELAAVQYSRDALKLRLETVDREPIAPAPRRRYAWPVAVAVAAISVAGVVLFRLDPWQGPTENGAGARVDIRAPARGDVPAAGTPTRPSETDSPAVPSADIAEGRGDGTALPKPEPSTENKGGQAQNPLRADKKQRPKKAQKGKGSKTPSPQKKESLSIEDCGNDPLCGILLTATD